VRVHLAAEHALEFEPAHVALERGRIALDLAGGRRIVLDFGELQQLAGVAQAGGRAIDFLELTGQACTLTPQLLGAIGRAPDAGILELTAYFFETFFLAVVLKETPSRRRHAPRDL
jgi:hypothetical protein